MFAEDLESGLGDLSILHVPSGPIFGPVFKDSRIFKDARKGTISEPENVVYIIGNNPNKTGM
jgi:hypothetical protein